MSAQPTGAIGQLRTNVQVLNGQVMQQTDLLREISNRQERYQAEQSALLKDLRTQQAEQANQLAGLSGRIDVEFRHFRDTLQRHEAAIEWTRTRVVVAIGTASLGLLGVLSALLLKVLPS